jgi:hypothetical protein
MLDLFKENVQIKRRCLALTWKQKKNSDLFVHNRVSLHVYIICGVEGKGVGMYNCKYCEIIFEFVNIKFKYE